MDAITFTEPKTKVALDMLKILEVAGAKTVLVILPEYDETTFKSFRNLANVTVKTAPVRSSAKGDEAPKTDVFSTRDLLVARKIVIAKDALVKVEEAWA